MNKEKILFQSFYEQYVQSGIELLKAEIIHNKVSYAAIQEDFCNLLRKQLEGIGTRCLILEMHRCKDLGMLQGNDAKKEYDYYVGQILENEDYKKEIQLRYPMLESCLVTKMRQTADNIATMINCFYEDCVEIEAKIFAGYTIHSITGLKGGMSDPHNGRLGVVQITLDHTKKLIYKSHTLTNEMIFLQWVRFLGQQINLNFQFPEILSRENYGWETYIEPLTCKNPTQVANYYERMGVYLFASYLLQANDLHCENLIAHGEHPVFVDMEALFGMRRYTGEETVDELINGRIQESVISSGILPFFHWNVSNRGVDISAISSRESQVMPVRIPVVLDAYTSDMRIGYRNGIIEPSQNVVTLQGKPVDFTKYTETMVGSFSAVYEYVCTHKAEVQDWIKNCPPIKSRYLITDTQKYSMMLSASYHPQLMRQETERAAYLRTFYPAELSIQENRIMQSEVKDLLQGDIPCYEFDIREKHLYAHGQILCENYFPETSLDGVLRKIEELNTTDQKQQISFIRLSMGGVEENHGKPISKDIQSAIMKLSNRILETAVYDRHNQVNWINYVFQNDKKRSWMAAPCGMYFYDGLAGINLIIHKLIAKGFGTDRHKQISRMLDSQMYAYTEQLAADTAQDQAHNSGLYNGEGSVLWVYLMIHQIGGRKSYLEAAKKHAGIVHRIAVQDPHNDLLDGKAGAILSLLYLYEETGIWEYLTWAIDVEKKLSQSATLIGNGMAWPVQDTEQALLGMAHGNAGISVAYGKLYELTGNVVYADVLEKTIRYEHKQYNNDTQDWYDYRASEDDIRTVKLQGAWCHGAGGILSARLEIAKLDITGELKDMVDIDIHRAVRTLKNNYARKELCLCHGVCGNLMIWEQYQKCKQDSGAEEICNKGLKYVIEQIAKNTVCTNQEKYGIGIMNGYGGILYYLLLHMCKLT